MSNFAAIAEAMKAEAVKRKKSRRFLARGLVLTLWRDGADWVLSLTRWAVRASDQEVGICRHAFGVPWEAEGEIEEINGYQVRRLRWAAASQEALFEVPEPPGKFYSD